MVKTVSMNFCVIDEGNFPCKMEKDMIKEKHVLPIDSQMTKDALLDPIELRRYGLSPLDYRSCRECTRSPNT